MRPSRAAEARGGDAGATAKLIIAMALFAGVMSALAAVRWNDWTYGTDTGTFAQIARNALHGFTDGPEGGTHFAFHWSPILALLYPLVRIAPSPLSLQIAQVVLIALTALPVYALARAYAGETWGLRCAVLALLYPPLLSVAFEEFHELAFYPLVVLALIWAADRARWGWFALFAVLAVLIREDVCVDLAVIGIALGVIALVRSKTAERGLLAGEPREPQRLAVAAFALSALALGALFVYAFAVLPRVGHWAPSHFYDYPFAHGPIQTALAVFTHPLALAASVLTFGRLTYLIEAFAPLALLPLATRWTWLAVPGFAGVLLASDPIVWRMGFHYSLLWVPWLLLAAVRVLARVAERNDQRTAVRWWRFAVGISLIVLIAFNPMHPAHYLRVAPFQQTASVQRAFACVPNSAPVMTHDEWFAHIALRYPKSTDLVDGAGRFPGYIVYSPEWKNAYLDRIVLPQIAAARAAGAYQVRCRYGDVTVLEPVPLRRTAG